MAYNKTNWDETTPRSLANLNNMENQYDEAVLYGIDLRKDNTKQLNLEVLSTLPTPGTAGRIFVYTVDEMLYYDDGTVLKRLTKYSGTLVGWGYAAYGELDSSLFGGGYTAFGCGYYTSFAIKRDGSIVGYGNDENNEISNIPAGTVYKAVAGGEDHAVTLKTDGSLASWGADTYNVVTDTPAGTDYIKIAAGRYFSVALRDDGSIVAWGRGGITEPPSTGVYVDIGASYRNGLAVEDDGSIVAWGTDYSNIVSNAPAGTGFVKVVGASRNDWATALKTDGSIVSWGEDGDGQVTDSPSGTGYIDIAAADRGGIAVDANNNLETWALGVSSLASEKPEGTAFYRVTAGRTHALAMI